MKIEFSDINLKDLYSKGIRHNKTFNMSLSNLHNYKVTIDKLKASLQIEDIYNLKSLNFKYLENSKEEGYVNIKKDYKLLIKIIPDSDNGDTISISSLKSLI